MDIDILFKTLSFGRYELKNRLMLPPLTRSRSSQPGNVANALMAEYYKQRAGAGFMVTEGTQIEPRGQGYAWTPGIHSEAQIEGWRLVTSAVHQKRGIIFAQLWHVGRVSHTSLQPNGDAPVGASDIPASDVSVFIEASPLKGVLVEPSTPRALETHEVEEIVEMYAQAARNAIRAGFDGVELHSANGYLINQFISDQTNNRTDKYGGSLENRLRLLKEVLTALSNAIGPDRVGVRFAPLFSSIKDSQRTYLGIVEDDPHTTYIEAVKIAESVGLAYVSIAESDWEGAIPLPEEFRKDLRAKFRGKIMYTGRYTSESGAKLINDGYADLIGFGRVFIANPDLPARIANNWPLNQLDASTLYGGSAEGYIDYPLYAF